MIINDYDFEFTEIQYREFKGMESTCKVFNGDGIIKGSICNANNDLFIIGAGGQKINIEFANTFLN